MQIDLYYNMSDDRQINKVLEPYDSVNGDFRDDVNIMSPVVRISTESAPVRCNYCYIPEFERYYFITSIDAFRVGVYDLTLSVDVLMSFRGDIMQLPAIVDKQTMEENGDEYIDDSSFITDNLMFATVYNYPNGFNDTPEYILITAG